jgi:hypothetical protein
MALGESRCANGYHSYFVADVAVVIPEGTVSVIALCTSCGKGLVNTHKVANPGNPIQIEKRN